VSTRANRLDSLVGRLAAVRDDELADEVYSAQASALLAEIVETPVTASAREPHGLADDASFRRVGPRQHRRRLAGVLAFAAAVVLAAALSIPAFGVGEEIISLFVGWRDPDAPVPTASDVQIASGEAGLSWKIVATSSDEGLCIGLFDRVGGDRFGSAGCGYLDIRGDLPRDIRGDPASNCLATSTSVVPCGSLPRHWIDLGGGGTSVGLERMFAYGPLADDVARVDLILTDGQTLRAHVVDEPDGLPLNFYWASWTCRLQAVDEGPYAGERLRECAEGREFPAAPAVKMAIARDAAGRVLERRVPAWNGNPTGDPNGEPPPLAG
jgi:hypothetical protein